MNDRFTLLLNPHFLERTHMCSKENTCVLFNSCLKERFSDHKNNVRNKHVNQATGAHFNEPGYTIEDRKIIAIE